jgi:hypothetical protein
VPVHERLVLRLLRQLHEPVQGTGCIGVPFDPIMPYRAGGDGRLFEVGSGVRRHG